MRRTASSALILSFILTLFFLFSSFAQARSQSVTILASKHKFSSKKQAVNAEQEKVAPKIDSGLVVISQELCQVKRRPADFSIQVPAPEIFAKNLSAKSAIVVDAATGQAIFGKSPDRPGQPASTIKVLTGLISLDSLQANEPVPVSRRAARMPRSKVYLRPGKTYPANDLINAVLLASANDASVALGEKIAGSEKMFAKLMTAKAESLGAANTVCRTASGLTSRGQYSTARDLAIIFNKAMDHNQFAQKMTRIKVKTRDGKVLRSHNKALWQIDGAQGGKTGYTNLARKTYVGKFARDNDEIVVAFLGSERMWDDVKRLVEYGFKKKAQINRQAVASAPGSDSSHLAKLVSFDQSSSQKALPIVLSGLSKARSL